MQQETQILWDSVKEEYAQNWRKAPSKLLFFFYPVLTFLQRQAVSYHAL